MKLDSVAFGGWPNCLRLSNGQAELILTTDVGPRVISYRVGDGPNVMKINPAELGGSGEDSYMPRGGHRLWLAPENDRTYEPDNVAVPYEMLSPLSVRLINPAQAPSFIRKELTVTLAASGTGVKLHHHIVNEGTASTEIAVWALTVMEAGGVAIIPQPPLGEHPRDLLPNRVIVPWAYTDLSDERFRFGRRYVTVRQSTTAGPTKIGLAHRQPWAGYALPGAFFVKTSSYQDGAAYPDLGCNFEVFTNDQILELETLSPMRTLAPGATLEHHEHWELFASGELPPIQDEASLEAWLSPFLSPLTLS